METIEFVNQVKAAIPSSVVLVVVAILIRQPLERMLSGLVFYFGKSFNNDDIVYVDGCKAIISRIGFFNTYFDILSGKGRTIKIRVVPNHRIIYLKLEKVIKYSQEEKDGKQISE